MRGTRCRNLADSSVLWLRFSDEAEGEVDFDEELWGELFEPLQDKRRFAEARLDEELGTVSWPNGVDFAAEYLYQRVSPTTRLN